MLKEFLPETEAPIGSLITFNVESPNWATRKPNVSAELLDVLGFPEVQSVVQWRAQASILGPGWASEGDFSETWDMF